MSGWSLRARLLRWLLVPLGLLWLADAAGTWSSAVGTVNGAYDRSLYASALAISERINLRAERPVVDIPPVALEVLDTEAQERIFYRVGYRTGGGPDAFLTGYQDLPPPPPGAPTGPVFHEATFHGYQVRIASLTTRFPTAPPITVVVQVAETVVGRSRLIRSLVARELAAQGAAILLASALVWFGISRGVRPLTELSRELAWRSAADLTPLPPGELPREVSPVVFAVNDLMVRLRRTLTAQRRFIADASHALRTPLAVLRTEADLALRQEELGAMRQAVARLRDHSEATSHLASQLLALARVGRQGEAVEAAAVIDLDAVARDACAALVPSALERQVDLGYEGAGPAPVRAREHEVREAIGNLVDNALRYGRPRGTVTVGVSRPGPGEACLAVEDDGPGIPDGDRERVLEPFHRLPGSPGDGAGLGLTIVREIAEGAGGSLRLLGGAGGRGLRVELRLPAA